MYLTFDEYQALGGKLDEQAFAEALPYAEALLDGWTLNRLKDPRSTKGENDQPVMLAVKIIIDRVKDIRAAYQAMATDSTVTSFSNGVDSFSFSGATAGNLNGNSAIAATYQEVTAILPTELVSACVSYNFAS